MTARKEAAHAHLPSEAEWMKVCNVKYFMDVRAGEWKEMGFLDACDRVGSTCLVLLQYTIPSRVQYCTYSTPALPA